jgi:hypothetical protein
VLDRPPRPDRARRAAQQRRHRLRLAAGRRVYPVELDGRSIDFLISLHWLDPAKAADDREVGDAIRRMVADAAKNV